MRRTVCHTSYDTILYGVKNVSANSAVWDNAGLLWFEVADMLRGLRTRGDASADLILAADAMVYVAELAPVLAEAARVLATGGLLAFTTETHDGEGVVIGQGLRYAHAAAYVRAVVQSAGLKLSLLEDRSARNEDNTPVPGLVAVAAKT